MSFKGIAFIVIFSILLLANSSAQKLSSLELVPTDQLVNFLTPEVRAQLENADEATLAKYFRDQFSERFFYDYQTVNERITHYNSVYSNQTNHQKRAEDHMGKYSDSTLWKLPFNYLSGEPVNAYALRHLARQHKMVDIAMHYFNDGRDPKYIRYFTGQMRSLNAALQADAYEKIEEGNGVYEAFRSGYRVLNWLWIHNMFLNESGYSDKDQLITIATLLQHGQHLYEHNKSFNSGNHQTRGVSALAMLSILLNDFEGTDLWYERAMLRLSEHLDKEINGDGFQFERSVHYHMSDINNYFYVYQLAKINGIQIDKSWENKLRGLFSSLVKIAYPDGSAPVLQDDTEIPWAEINDISESMTLGYLLFEDPEFGFFATDQVDEKIYWFLSKVQIQLLEKIDKKKPEYGSLAFEETGYYVMREGWEKDDRMMIISAGLDDEKPDHQHGDMLGIQAMANGYAILPNYQVRYSLPDFDFFKNSMVKNVALVDDELQGKQWTSNKGGSGFGKFKELPRPEVIAWKTNNEFDFFAGRHDGFENVGVDYSRQVIFMKNGFWIVKDNFRSNEPHDYKQVWQGHYTTENGPDLLRSTAQDASGHDILQFNTVDTVTTGGSRGKQWSVVTKLDQTDYSFLTIIYPYRGYNNRFDESDDKIQVGEWKMNDSKWEINGENQTCISNSDQNYCFGIKSMSKGEYEIEFSQNADIHSKDGSDQIKITLVGTDSVTYTLKKKGKRKAQSGLLYPGDSIILETR